MNRLIRWAAAGVLITLVFGSIYSVGQQILRQSANDPQIQLAEDTATNLNNGATPGSLVSGNIKIDSSLAPFIIIYDKSGKVVAGNGYLGRKVPVIPYGALSSAKPNKCNAVTWQPAESVRIASVEVAANDFYVLSGRSLRETENRAKLILEDTLLGYVVSLLVLGSVFVFTELPPKSLKKPAITRANH